MYDLWTFASIYSKFETNEPFHDVCNVFFVGQTSFFGSSVGVVSSLRGLFVIAVAGIEPVAGVIAPLALVPRLPVRQGSIVRPFLALLEI